MTIIIIYLSNQTLLRLQINLLGWVDSLRVLEMDGRPLPVTDCTKFLIVPRYITFAGEPSAAPPPITPFFKLTPFATHAALGRHCTLHPRCIAPGGARTWHHYLSSLECHKICLLTQGNGFVVRSVLDKGGGDSIYLHNSLTRILHLQRNFAIICTIAKTITFSNIRDYKIITVQIS